MSCVSLKFSESVLTVIDSLKSLVYLTGQGSDLTEFPKCLEYHGLYTSETTRTAKIDIYGLIGLEICGNNLCLFCSQESRIESISYQMPRPLVGCYPFLYRQSLLLPSSFLPPQSLSQAKPQANRDFEDGKGGIICRSFCGENSWPTEKDTFKITSVWYSQNIQISMKRYWRILF